MPLPKSVCKDCKKREIGCHVDCPDYISFSEEMKRINQNRAKHYELEKFLNASHFERYKKEQTVKGGIKYKTKRDLYER